MIIKQRYVRELAHSRRRTVPLAVAVAALFGLLLLRLWYLQIIMVEDYRAMSENNRLRFLPVAASRGALMDRNGAILVNNRPSFSLSIIPQEVKDVEVLLDRLSALLVIDREELAERWKNPGAVPATIRWWLPPISAETRLKSWRRTVKHCRGLR